jgi:hypothetical protein
MDFIGQYFDKLRIPTFDVTCRVSSRNFIHHELFLETEEKIKTSLQFRNEVAPLYLYISQHTLKYFIRILLQKDYLRTSFLPPGRNGCASAPSPPSQAPAAAIDEIDN